MNFSSFSSKHSDTFGLRNASIVTSFATLWRGLIEQYVKSIHLLLKRVTRIASDVFVAALQREPCLLMVE